MTTIELKNVTVELGGVEVLKDISLTIKSGDFVALLGPTNAGKTTLLYTIAGLISPSKGRIYFDGKDVTDLPPQKRDVAMVFQVFALYPNLTVFENIASPLLVRKIKRDEMKKRINEIAEILGLKNLLEKKPSELSGGEAQRVVIGRALAKGSNVILMDEPLTNLDYKLRESLISDLKRLFGKGGRTVIYSTANPMEASSLANTLVFIYGGRIIQTGPIKECLRNPVNVTAAKHYSVPPINIVEGAITSKDGKKVLEVPGLFTYDLPDQGLKADTGECLVGIYPYSLKLTPEEGENIEVTGTLILQEIQGSDMLLTIKSADNLIAAYIPYVKLMELDAQVTLYVKPRNIYLFDKESGRLVSRLPERGR